MIMISCPRIAGIHITAVTVGDRATFEIRGIASDPDSSNVIVVQNFRDLPTVQPNLVAALCDGQYITPVSNSNTGDSCLI